MRNYEAVFIFRTEAYAYQIKKETRGHYYPFDLELKPGTIIRIEKDVKLFNEVLKFMSVKK